jgi:hypothetical protein
MLPTDVLARVDNYLKMRVPELIEINIEDPRQLDGTSFILLFS